MSVQMEPPESKSNSLLFKYTRIAVIVALYWFVSISLVFLNKQILSGKSHNLNAPFFVTWFQCLISLLITTGLSVAFNYQAYFGANREGQSPLVGAARNKMFSIPPIFIRISVIRQIVPLAIVFVAMISFNNLCLQNVGVAFYFVGRSLTTVFNVLLSFLILHKSTSTKAIICCIVLVFGFYIGVDQEQLIGTLSISGVIYGVLASFFVSLNAIFISRALSFVNHSVWLLSFYNNLIAIFLFIPLMVINGEFQSLITVHQESNSVQLLWTLLLISSLFGFLIGFVTTLQIKYTSPLTHNISGTAKACAQTILATQIYVERKTINWWLSNFIVLAASAAYTRVKQLEMKYIHQSDGKNPTKDENV